MTAASSSTASSSASSSTSQDRHHRNVARGTAPRAAPRSSRRSPRAAAEEERRRSGGGDPARMGDPGQVEELEPYSVLGVSRTDSPRALRRRYQELVRQLHPDRAAQGLGKGEREEQLRRFLEVERAWRTLGDAETRRAHDLRARGTCSRRVPSRTASPLTTWTGTTVRTAHFRVPVSACLTMS
ncbi:uncharacterized protein LOC144720394 isoform X5 [Lampetra planeri]